jgi:hypothetical protein
MALKAMLRKNTRKTILYPCRLPWYIKKRIEYKNSAIPVLYKIDGSPPKNITDKEIEPRKIDNVEPIVSALSKKNITSGNHVTELRVDTKLTTENIYPLNANTIDENNAEDRPSPQCLARR